MKRKVLKKEKKNNPSIDLFPSPTLQEAYERKLNKAMANPQISAESIVQLEESYHRAKAE